MADSDVVELLNGLSLPMSPTRRGGDVYLDDNGAPTDRYVAADFSMHAFYCALMNL